MPPIIQPISPPFGTATTGYYKCFIEVNNKVLEASWKGQQPYPDFMRQDSTTYSTRPLQLSDAIVPAWIATDLLAYGSDACIRITKSAAFPVVKIAHPILEARRRVEREFEIVLKLSSLKIAAEVAVDPLLDENGVCGFWLEQLVQVTWEDLKARGREIEQLVGRLHQAGYCHGDLTPSNIMQNGAGRLVLIDFGFSGVVGEETHSCIPKGVYPSNAYDT